MEIQYFEVLPKSLEGCVAHVPGSHQLASSNLLQAMSQEPRPRSDVARRTE